jgi:RNA polymerase sigma-70 factor (ECF subfamily)
VNNRELHELHGLMVRLADGDRRAFDGVFVALQPAIVRLCRHLLPDAADAEDAAQAALLKIFLEASRFNPERDAVGWALSIAAFECRTVRQKRRRLREEAMAPGDALPDERTPEADALDADLRSTLEAVLQEMTPRDRETLRAVAGQGDRPAVPPATFRKRAERALRRFREVWRSRYGLD